MLPAATSRIARPVSPTSLPSSTPVRTTPGTAMRSLPPLQQQVFPASDTVSEPADPAISLQTGDPTVTRSNTTTTQVLTTADPRLDQSLPAFEPQPRPSNTTVRLGKSKSKTGTATSKEEIALEFSRVEVNTIKARLKTLETKKGNRQCKLSVTYLTSSF